jgi:hypothetical protein
MVIPSSRIREESEVFIEGGQSTKVGAQRSLINKDSAQLSDLIDSCSEVGTLEITSKRSATAAKDHHVVIQANLFQVVGKERGDCFSFPAVTSKLERSEERKDGVTT